MAKKYNVEQVLEDRAAHIVRIRKADAAARKKKKSAWIVRLKKRVQRILKSRHSPAGKKHMKLRYREEKHPALRSK